MATYKSKKDAEKALKAARIKYRDARADRDKVYKDLKKAKSGPPEAFNKLVKLHEAKEVAVSQALKACKDLQYIIDSYF